MASLTKVDRIKTVFSGHKRKYECQECSKVLCSKQVILQHLHAVHNMSPVKRVKKLYLDNKEMGIPERTLFRWKQKQKLGAACQSPSKSNPTESGNGSLESNGLESHMLAAEIGLPPTAHSGKSCQSADDLPNILSAYPSVSDVDNQSAVDSSLNSFNNCSSNFDNLSEEVYTKEDSTNNSKLFDPDISRLSDVNSNTDYSSDSDSFNADLDSLSDTYQSVAQKGYPDSDECNTSFTEPADSSASDTSSISTSEPDYLSDESNTTESEPEFSSDPDQREASRLTPEYSSNSDNDGTCNFEHEYGGSNCYTSVMTNEQEVLKLVSCFRRHNLTTSACKDIIDTTRCIFKDSKNAHILNYNYLMSFIETNKLNEVHYCEFCNEVFPSDPDEFQCNSLNCQGLRYLGTRLKQTSRNRQPRKCFIIADVNKQLTDLLQTPGITDDILEQKAAALSRKDEDIITDIHDGSAYRELLKCNTFLSSKHHLSAIINTDGVNLYSSSKVELWPVFLAINELSPKVRFSRENLLLVGIWQGKGKPPFKQYIESIAPYLNSLYIDGVDVTVNGSKNNWKLKVVCGVFDLPAKAGILNMTYYNGKNACITCEETGLTVRQGKGTSRSYPDRNGHYTLRTHEDVLECMQSGTDKKRMKGLKGISGMASIQSFDLVSGVVPDYMHAVLLGVTSTLMLKWFSPTESKKRHFIGSHLKKISRRLQSIQPPASIERLPRDLEKNYRNLKATELQAWLLFYALPCLIGILPDDYLEHFSYLSEAIYILLGDRIKQRCIERAEHLLNAFYADFVKLYGEGSCGLNVHNTCAHLIHYVKLWGPLWAWSCFGFEDNNAMLLQAVHGTGVVTKQIMWYKQVESTLRRKSGHEVKSRIWKKKYQAANCDVSGKMVSFENREFEELLKKNDVRNIQDVKQINRICVNGRPFCSLKYTRMKKRICSYVLYENNKIGCVRYFVLHSDTNIVYAVVEQNDICEDAKISDLPAGKHLIPVKASGNVDIVPVENLIDTLVYIKVHPELSECVALMPSRHGHAIFK